jgi:MFS family permease
LKDLSQRTFRVDLFRSSLNGILEVGFNVFVILIAIRFLDASQGFKSLLAAGSAFGFFLMPWTSKLSALLQKPVTHIAGYIMLICSLSLMFCSQVKSILPYTACLLVAQISLSQMPGLMIHVYSSNYNSSNRGRSVSWNFIFASSIGMIFSYLFGVFLDQNGSLYYFLFWGMGLIAFSSSVALFLIPSTAVKIAETSSSLLGGLTYIYKDRLFRKMLFGWMLMGLGVIMTIPVRIEYVAGNGGMGMTNKQIAILFGVSMLSGVLTSRIWGKLFDQISFVPYRLSLNFFLLFSIIIFFSSSTFWGLAIGAILGGVATGGASIAWSLWVMKIAPDGRESDYMGAHVFMTGIRGALAPFLGYFVLGLVGFNGVIYCSSFLILASVLIFLSEIKSPRLSV